MAHLDQIENLDCKKPAKVRLSGREIKLYTSRDWINFLKWKDKLKEVIK